MPFLAPLSGPPAAALPPGEFGAEPGAANRGELSVWFLSARNRLVSLTAPPMTEGIAARGGRLAILFESAALRYRYTGSYPLDRIELLPLTSLRRP